VIDPSSATEIAQVTVVTVEDTDIAVTAAYAAKDRWAALTPSSAPSCCTGSPTTSPRTPTSSRSWSRAGRAWPSNGAEAADGSMRTRGL
jgi:hypothetical protein